MPSRSICESDKATSCKALTRRTFFTPLRKNSRGRQHSSTSVCAVEVALESAKIKMVMMALSNRMQSRALVGQLLLVLLLHPLTVLAITSLSLYPNASCGGTSSNAIVSSIAHDGPCGHPVATTKSLAATVSDASQTYDCTGQSPCASGSPAW